MGINWTGQIDTLADVLKRIDDTLAILELERGNSRVITLLSEAGNRLECYIACNDDNGQDVANADESNHVTG